MSSRPTSEARRRRQKLKRKYARLREDAQLQGIIETSPEGAVRDERVNPHAQSSQQLPALVREAVRNNWATPDAAKPAIVDSLSEPFFSSDVVLDKDGNQVKVPPNQALQIECAKTLMMLDQTQWERDHPEESGKAKGGGTNVGVTVVNLDALCKPPENALDPLEAALKTLPQSCPQGPEENANGAVPPTEPSE